MQFGLDPPLASLHLLDPRVERVWRETLSAPGLKPPRAKHGIYHHMYSPYRVLSFPETWLHVRVFRRWRLLSLCPTQPIRW